MKREKRQRAYEKTGRGKVEKGRERKRKRMRKLKREKGRKEERKKERKSPGRKRLCCFKRPPPHTVGAAFAAHGAIHSSPVHASFKK